MKGTIFFNASTYITLFIPFLILKKKRNIWSDHEPFNFIYDCAREDEIVSEEKQAPELFPEVN